MGQHVPKEKRDTWADIQNFIENKAGPAIQAGKSVMKDRTFNGQKPTIGGIIRDLTVPMPMQNVIDLESERKRNNR